MNETSAMTTATLSERDARDTAIARVTMASADWQSFARRALLTIACEREEFTTDDVWRLLHERGIPDPPEHRSMSGATGFGRSQGIIERTPVMRGAEHPATHNHAREQRVWRSLIVGEEPPEWPAPVRRAYCPECGASLSALEDTVSPRWVRGSCPTHGRQMARLT